MNDNIEVLPTLMSNVWTVNERIDGGLVRLGSIEKRVHVAACTNKRVERFWGFDNVGGTNRFHTKEQAISAVVRWAHEA